MMPEELASKAVIVTTFDNTHQEFARYENVASGQGKNVVGFNVRLLGWSCGMIDMQ